MEGAVKIIRRGIKQAKGGKGGVDSECVHQRIQTNVLIVGSLSNGRIQQQCF